MNKKIILKRVLHRDKWRILISFKYDAVLTGLVRQIKGSLYSNTYKGWYVDDTEQNLNQIYQNRSIASGEKCTEGIGR